MIKKEEKKHLFLKIIMLLVVIFFAVMAFIDPKPAIQTIDKTITKPLVNE